LVFLVVFAGHSQRPFNSLIFGGSGNDSINAAAVDSSGNIYVVGTTASFDFPLRNAFQAANSGTELIYSVNAGATWTPLANPLAITPLTSLSIAADPTNSQVVYAASGAGICKSTDAGQQFHCVALTFASFQTTLTSLAIDPQQPSTLYASATTNGGVFKSADGGQTWASASAGLPSQGFIDSVAVDPFHAGVLYAWAGSGGYVSTNGASSWAPSSMPWPANTSVSGPGGPSFSFDPVTPGIIYGPNYPANQLGVQKSVDGGATWTPLNTPFSSCCVVPDPKVSGTLYALASANNTAPLLFWKSTDGGVTWNSYPFPGSFTGPLAVDPANPQIMLDGEFRSTDGGQTWQPTNASRLIQPAFSNSSSGIVYAAAPITSDAFLAKFLPDGQTLVFSTYFGGMGSETGQGIALDASGNIWITGSTSSYDLPVTQGAFQGALKGGTNAFLAKFSGDGKLLAASYLGGANTDNGLGIAISAQGNSWLIANSNSTDFPVTTPGISTPAMPIGYVTELNSSASQLLYSASAGGTFDANGKGIAIDSSGNITLTGSAYAAFPITAGAFHSGALGIYTPKAFVLKLSPSGQVIYSTYFGGSQAAPTIDGFGGGVEDEHDYGIAVAVDPAGNAYVAGYTSASDFPTTQGAYQTSLAGGCPYPALTIGTGLIGTFSYYYVDDVFVVKLSPDGKTAIASTLLGGSCYDHPTSIAVSASGEVYVSGETDSANFPLVSPIQGAPPTRQFASFVSVFDPALSALTFSTYLYAGATPSVTPGPGKSIRVIGAIGPGAQTMPDTGFPNPFPTVATDGYLVTVKPPHPVPGLQR
jgi:photosystem II stability/assembly factor-like uncharacterized protein